MQESDTVPVTCYRHRDKTWRPPTSFAFAAAMTNCEIVAAETDQTAAAFPIVFRAEKDKTIPVALFSVSNSGPNPFVSATGQWRATYVPSALRCFPFCMEPGKPSCLSVNEDWGLTGEDQHGLPFFEQQDCLSPRLKEVSRFLESLEAEREKSRHICEMLREMDLLTPFIPKDTAIRNRNLQKVSNDRIDGLSRAQRSLLLSTGALRLVHAHQISLSHIGWMSKLNRAADTFCSESSVRMNGFLKAVANDVLSSAPKEEGFGVSH